MTNSGVFLMNFKVLENVVTHGHGTLIFNIYNFLILKLREKCKDLS